MRSEAKEAKARPGPRGCCSVLRGVAFQTQVSTGGAVGGYTAGTPGLAGQVMARTLEHDKLRGWVGEAPCWRRRPPVAAGRGGGKSWWRSRLTWWREVRAVPGAARHGAPALSTASRPAAHSRVNTLHRHNDGCSHFPLARHTNEKITISVLFCIS